MLDESQPSSPHGGALVALVPSEQHEWQPIFHVSNQVVLYNPTSHALSIRHSANFPPRERRPCPYCHQTLPADFLPPDSELEDEVVDSEASFRASNYFHLLEIANDTTSRPSTPPSPSERRNTFPAEAMAEGYFKAFFQEEYRLGMGANGSVYLCQHVLDGNPLGHFAVKKIAVGESHSYLINILKEVRLLEQLHHPNIVTYHHAWLESCQFSSFGPKVPTLHVLMQWAEGGSLDDFIDVRLGRRSQHIHMHPAARLNDDSRPQTPAVDNNEANSPGPDQLSRSARIRAFREFQRAPPEQRERIREEMTRSRNTTTWTAVHLLSAEEVKSLFRDVVEGLGFLHDKSILHLDLKPGNVLLTWDEGKLIPRAMLSDFGTSRDMLHSSRSRSGNTGTLEYTSPESLPSPHTGLLHPVDSKADMWSLGMILHKLLLFKLPYQHASDGEAGGSKVGEGDKMDRLESEVLTYPGFKSNQTLAIQFEARRLPRAFLVLLESLLHVTPSGRPSCERVSTAIREGRLDPIPPGTVRTQNGNSLIPAPRRHSNPDVVESITANQESKANIEQRSDGHLSDTPAPDGEHDNEWEETKSLLLTAPIESLTPWTMITAQIPQLPQSTVLFTRSIKSGIVITKILTALSICPTGRPNVVATTVLFALAVIDTWFDGLWVSLFFGLLHVGIMRFGCWGNVCCT
ncbi:kinase-like domain-containing protein [Mycena alexandri]|uniref:non-specific serine/threonine protein kinase n=1 Tax=Mycena alexandri TaxID=1745969 RepID=A0AAD6SJ64_9AGAR|nr:kinase-like domain-containing protein [Mycena alexandri]